MSLHLQGWNNPSGPCIFGPKTPYVKLVRAHLVHLQHHLATFVPFFFVKIATHSGKTKIVGWKMGPDWRYVSYSNWWFQPIWKYASNWNIFPRDRGQNKKHLKPPPGDFPASYVSLPEGKLQKFQDTFWGKVSGRKLLLDALLDLKKKQQTWHGQTNQRLLGYPWKLVTS